MNDTRVQELFGDDRNADPFRLTILAHTKIEETLDEALEDAFGGNLPGEVRGIHFKAKVALAVALNLLPDTFRGPLGKLTKLRNDFAHGKITELTVSDARQLYAATREIVPEIDTAVPGLKDEDQGEIQLVSLLMILEVGMVASFQDARELRARQHEALRTSWARGRLTREEIVELLSKPPG